MGTPFSVMYAVIYMLYIESPVVEAFGDRIALYRRYIDDITVVWKGSAADFKRFQEALASRHPSIRLEWASCGNPSDSSDPNRTIFMDCDIVRIVKGTSVSFEYA
eukprot:3388299-Rhodomonas_salina.1